jgi:N-acetylneuraminic acid mutarotase
MMRRGRLRAPVTVLVTVCLGLLVAAQSPASAASAAPTRQTVTSQPAKASEPQAAVSASAATPAPQDSGYQPAGCYSATPKKGTASCFALVRTSDGRVRIDASGPPTTALTPADIQAAYHLPATGQGQTVAVVDAYGYSSAEADLAVFRQQYGLPACTTQNGCFRKVDQQGGTDYPADDAGWSTETALDLDAISSACPACHILLVEANTAAISDLGSAAETAVALGAKFVSNSYGASDAAVAGQVSDTYYNHPGVVITASTGDIGNEVEWPSSDPDVVAVGGTTLTAASGTSRGWTETAWSKGGSGCSSFEPQPVYQSDLPTDCANRATADISADADPDSGLAEYDTLNGGWEQVGGTSLASPLIASMYALAGTPAAGTYPATYPYIHAAGDLFDVTGGSNGTCGDVLCTAGAGWDGPTGLGTPNGVAALTLGPQGTVGGKITDTATGTPLAGASVVLTDSADQLTFRAVTDSGGGFQVSVSAGTYDVSASKFDYGTATISGVSVAAGGSATKDVALAKITEREVTGKVTDSGHGWSLYAQISIAGDPNGPVYTDPATGAYSVALPEQTDFTMQVVPQYPGYTTSDTTVAVGTSSLRHDVSVTPETAGCTAPGYAYPTQADFDGWTTAPEYGWTVTGTSATGTSTTGWQFDDPGAEANLTGGTGDFATADPQDNGGVAEDTDLTSPTFSLAGQRNADLQFSAAAVLATGSEADASFTDDGGKTWTPVYQATNGIDGAVDVPLTQALGHRDVQVRFHFSGQGQALFQLANVSVGQCQALGGGLIQGAVTDANTRQPLNGATITDTSAPVTDPFATAVSTTNADDANLPGGFYWLYSPTAGRNTLTTTMPRYTTAHATVTASDVVDTYDPVMAAGRLKVTPQTVSLKSALGSKASQDITLTNTGTAPLRVTLEAQNLSSSASTATAPTAGSWQSLPAYPEPVMDNVVASYEGDTYSVGGTENALSFLPPYDNLVKQNYVYTPGAASWSQIADLPQYRTAATGAFVDGTLYVVGGMDYPATGGGTTFESTTYAYHPSSNSWSQVADLPQALAFADAAVYNGELYVIGGRNAAGDSSADAYRYDPAGNTWTQVADYPTPTDSGGCGGVVGGIVCAGGSDTQNGDAALTSSTYLYHPASNTWTRGADMPYSDYLGSYSSANGELQVAGGVAIGPGGQSEGAVENALQYDPVADVWTNLPDVPVGVFAAGRGTGCGLTEVGGASAGVSGGSTGAETLPGFGQCGSDNVNWLSESETTVELAPGRSTRIQLDGDAGVLSAPGDYAAGLSLITDSPYLSQPVPVTLQATAPASWAQISGTVTDAATGDALPGATIVVSRAGRHPVTVTTDSLGRYDVWLGQAALTISVSHNGYSSISKEVTTLRGGDTQADFALSAS